MHRTYIIITTCTITQKEEGTDWICSSQVLVQHLQRLVALIENYHSVLDQDEICIMCICNILPMLHSSIIGVAIRWSPKRY